MTINPIVSADWLHAHQHDTNIVIVDASWHMPTSGRNGYEEFLECAIEGAVFFDIDAHSDTTSDLPHMMPPIEAFATTLASLGISNDTHVIIYDGAGLFSAARLWWMLCYIGHKHVSVLDGGLPAWRAADYPTAKGRNATSQPSTYTISATKPELIANKQQVFEAIENASHLILDARGKARFDGTVAEPRAGLRSGHMPNAINIPFNSLLDEPHHTLKSPEALRHILADALTSDKPIITSCGSGVTACIISLALTTLGKDSAVYDGSWAEWGGDAEMPIIKTAA